MNIRVENRCKSPRAERLALSERISVRSGSSLLLSLLLIAFSDLWFLCSAGRYPSIQGQTQSRALCLHTALQVERRARKLMFALRNYILPLLLYLLFVDRRKEKKKHPKVMSTVLNRWMYDIISCTICKRLINYDWMLILWQKQQDLVHKNVWIGIFF